MAACALPTASCVVSSDVLALSSAVIVAQRLPSLPVSAASGIGGSAQALRAAARDLLAELGLELAHGGGVAVDLFPLAGRAERLQTIELAQRVVEHALAQLERPQRFAAR